MKPRPKAREVEQRGTYQGREANETAGEEDAFIIVFFFAVLLLRWRHQWLAELLAVPLGVVSNCLSLQHDSTARRSAVAAKCSIFKIPWRPTL